MSDAFSDESKWLKRWEEDGAFEPEPDNRKSFYLTVAYPYPSGGMHIGHARTYTVPDVIARFKRMQGYNVLFPMAWHVTGTPIIGALKRLKEKEKKQMELMRDTYSMTDEAMAGINEPMDFARYFIDEHYRPSMRRLGYSIDWRRQFTTNDPGYKRFISWQYRTLRDKGLVMTGLHPVKFCAKCENPVTTHDLLEGEDADVQDFTLIKFAFGGDFIIAATLRPETIYGQTNMWVNPDVEYVKADVGGEKWIISGPCAKKLKMQGFEVKLEATIGGSEMMGKKCVAPGVEREIPILPSSFPDPDIGTGLVTSVPSDAPYDFIALKDLQDDEKTMKKYGLDINAIRLIRTIPIIEIEGFGPDAAKDIVERMGIKSQKDTEKLREATQEVYKAGFHTGVMNPGCGPYSGMPVARAKDRIREGLIQEGRAANMLEFSEPVKCRCGGDVMVAKAESWFIDYGNEDWKEQVRGAIHNMDAIPDRTRQDYLNTVDWLRQWPCIRNFGLGTRLPFDDRFVIEPLSDSTIYMAYYTISHMICDIPDEKLSDEFFDFVFRDIGDVRSVSEGTGIDSKRLTGIKESFDYWYPQDYRCSALELIQNHLTFMLYHHTAIFPPDKWPKGIASFGMGLLEGAKMSSSKGNVILVKDAVKRHGADIVRLFLMGNAEPWMDFDWREDEVNAVGRRLSQFIRQVRGAKDMGGRTDERIIDRWMRSKVAKKVEKANESLEAFQTRKALQSIFYEMFRDISWYMRRDEPNRDLMREISGIWVRLMAPFTPFVCEQLWMEIGGEGLVSKAPYPKASKCDFDPDAEAVEDYLMGLVEDIQSILKVTNKVPKSILIYTYDDWKLEVIKCLREGKNMGEIMADPEMRKRGSQVAKLAKTRPEQLPDVLFTPKKERQIIDEAGDFLFREFNAKIITEPDEDPAGKRGLAGPGKPGIYII